MAILDGFQPFILDRFFSGFYLTSNPTLPPPTSALYPSQDFLLDQGMIRKRPGDREFQTTPQVLTGRLQKAFDWLDNSGTRHLFVLTTTNLYHYNTGTGNFDSFLSGLVGSPDIIPQAASFFGKMLFFNGGNKVFKSDGTLGGTSIIATAPVAKTGTVFGGRVIVGNVVSGAGTTGPTAVVWSNSLDETNWTTGSAGANQLDRDDDQIQRMVIYRSQLMIARRKSVNVSSVLVTSPYYSFESLVEGLGTPFPDSVQVFPLGVIFAGDENLYLLTGTVPTPIGFGVREFLLGANLSFAGRTVGTVNLSEGRYYLGIPFGADQDPVDVLAYNYQEGHVEYWKKPNLTGLGASYFSQGVTWASMTNPWATYTMTWDELGALASQQQTLYLKADGTVYSETDLQRKDRYNGADVLYGMTFKTPLFALGPQGQGQQTDPSPSLVEFVQLDCQPNMANLTVQLGWSRGAGTPPTVSTARTVAVPTSGVMAGAVLLGFDTREAPYWQLTIQDAVANEDPRIMRAVLWSRKRGRTVR